MRRWAPLLRIAASVVMLAILVPRVHLSSIVPNWSDRTIALLAGALLVTLVGIVLSAVRWQRVLDALDLRAPITLLLRHYLAALFVGNFLPSTIGGDVLRVSRLSASNGQTPATFASVVLERLTGWIVLPIITLTGLALNPGLLRLGAASTVALLISLTTLALLGLILAMAASPKVGGRLDSNEGWRRFTGAVHFGLGRFRHKPAAALEVVIAGFMYQLAVVFAAFLAARTLGLDAVGWTAVLAFMPAVAIVQVLPITIGGLGVREGAFVLFLHPLGVSSSKAIALGLLVYGINLVVSLLGAPAFAAGGGRAALHAASAEGSIASPR